MSNRDKLTKVNINGTGTTESGKLVQTKFFRTLARDLDDYSDISFTKDEAVRINNHLSKLSTGSTAIVPLICGGKEVCPFSDRCLFADMDKLPIGRQCLIETNLLKHYTLGYMEDYEVDPDNFTELSYCAELAEIEIYLQRLNYNLAKPANAELVVDQPMGTDRDGNPILQKQISPFMEMKEKFLARKRTIVKLMVGDRQERYRREAALKQKEDKDASSQQAKMRNKIELLSRKLDELQSGEQKALPSKTEPNVLTPDALLASEDIPD
jgi:hypothetical protein